MRLLIIKLNALGDLVIASPAFQRLRSGLPEAEIHLLTTDWSAPAMQGNPNVDETIVVPNAVFFRPGLRTVKPTLVLYRKLRRFKYDAAVLFHKHKAVIKFVDALGLTRRFHFSDLDDYAPNYDQFPISFVPLRRGLTAGDLLPFSARRNRNKIAQNSVVLDESRHSALTAWELADLAARELGGRRVDEPALEDLRYEWFCSEAEIEAARDILHRWGLDEHPIIVLFPGGGRNPNLAEPARRWPPPKWAQLSQRLMSKFGCRIVLLGSRDDAEACALANKFAAGRLFDLAGRYSIRQTAALLKFARLAITNDSAPVHISAAVGIPTVGIYGPNGAQHKLPPGNCLGVSAGLPCSPCFFTIFKGCIFDRIHCMEDLTAEFVFEKIMPFIEANSAGL
ncbi:MAG: glycosyltransferase family 9 protein [Calditrichaeota bacterium]|nr:glycosyltransferase family 9 protein [Calditrichota bacterium]